MERVLAAYASEHGATAEIAKAVGEELGRSGLPADVVAAAAVRDLTPYRAVVLGSAVYMSKWRKDALRFLHRFDVGLAERDVYLFQSGPLDLSAQGQEIPLPRDVATLATRIGAHGHVTFVGKLGEADSGFVARKFMRSGKFGAYGDFRNFERIKLWAVCLARELRSTWSAIPA